MRINRTSRVVWSILVVAAVTWSALPASAGDWPQWRYGPGRGAAAPDDLPAQMTLLWWRQLPPAAPAWPASQYKLQFDAAYEPVAAGKLLFVPSNVSDRVTAYATDTGREVWRFYAEAPVRFAPVVYKDKVIFVSDDGWVYCVGAADGKEQWRFRAAPRELRVIGNNRLTSAWPVRGAPVLFGGKIYFAASIWPFMGVFHYCLDAETGKVVWSNSGESARWTTHPHGAPSFASVAPQGYFAADGNDLIVPGGRSTPGVFERDTGKLWWFNYDKKFGGSRIFTGGGFFFCQGTGLDLVKGKPVSGIPMTILDGLTVYGLETEDDEATLAARALKTEQRDVITIDSRGRKRKTKKLFFVRRWDAKVRGMTGAMIKAGSRIYGTCTGGVCAMPVPARDGAGPAWSARLDGTPRTMLAADGKLFVVTAEGRIYCFGAAGARTAEHPLQTVPLAGKTEPWKPRVAGLVKDAESGSGYAVVLGAGAGALVQELLAQSSLDLIVIERDAAKAGALRRRLDDAGLYGKRATVVVGDPLDYPLSPYLAGVIVSESPSALGLTPDKLATSVRLLNALRPYGGSLRLGPIAGDVAAAVAASGVQTLKVATSNKHVVVRRTGPLPGSDVWTHQYGDVANQVVNADKLVKLPLGLLWFGGPSNDDILPRHGHGPSPQVAGGRLVIEGPDILRCVDVYTGRVLWERRLPGVGSYYDYTGHQPGAGAIGSNTVTLPDAVYVVHEGKCLKLDPNTGKTVRELPLPAGRGNRVPNWGYIGVHGDLLIAGVAPMAVEHGMLNAVRTIRPHEKWQYLAGAHAPEGWTKIDFKADGWKTGPAGFGYADNDDRTVLDDMLKKYTTVYIRKTFDGAALKEATHLALAVSYDDGFIAYLNGVEVIRAGVSSGRGAKVGRVFNHEAGSYKTFAIKDFQKLITPGKNVIALEGHNAAIDSSDFSLDPYLVAGKAGPVAAGRPSAVSLFSGVGAGAQYARGSTRLVVMDRNSGQVLWSRDAVYTFRHNGIVAGAGMIYCLDRLDKKSLDSLKRRGLEPRTDATLYALDARTGREIWKSDEGVFGTWLAYAKAHGMLIQGGSKYRDRAKDEAGEGIVAYEAKTGKVIWADRKLKYGGPVMIHGDTLITNGSSGYALDIKTGLKTGWKWKRQYGCNTAIASEYIMTFRSGAAGFCDITGTSGTGNFGGFKSSCTSNLIPADGVLSAPDYTRTCTCAYQNQSSLALVNMPGNEVWTFGGTRDKGVVGLNFGAPGNRRGPGGTLWVDWPNVGGESPVKTVTVDGKTDVPPKPSKTKGRKPPVGYFPGVKIVRIHSALMGAGDLKWVGASAVLDVKNITMKLPAGTYTVRLVFAELGGAKRGQRLMNVSIQGKPVLAGLDIAAEASGPRRTVIKTFKGVEVDGALKVDLSAPKGRTILSGLEAVRQ